MRLDEVRALLDEAMWVYQDSPRASTWLRDQSARLDEPLRLAVTGPPGAGKSTLVNVLIGTDVAPVPEASSGQALTWYQDGPETRVTVYPPDAAEVVVELPVRVLRHAWYIDTPPVSDAALGRRILRDADAVLYLTRHLDEQDLAFLEMARQGTVAAAAPVNVLTVLSRADELAGAGLGALVEAKQLARRHRRDPLTQHVVALSPRLARAASTLTPPEFTALTLLAAVPRQELDPSLLSVDRFTASTLPGTVDAPARRALLERLGLPGVRLAVVLVRAGARTAEVLSAELTRRSGLTELRESLRELFLDRRDTLKARSALTALEFMLRAEPLADGAGLLAALDRVVAGAHDFQELRLLASLRAGRLTLPRDLLDSARRLLGAHGTSPAARLGADDDLWTLGTSALRRWRPLIEDATFTPDQRRAAVVIVRTCETLMTQLGAAA